ncbi:MULTISPECIES: clostripain-related cysteine peptidase [Spirulina sp. CCY15215]|uniref:clostripain-related cysteine peptidase n=1 Tax=Spirulina sp. CCY15215 TaxID=2767591 RepID=UPI0019518FE0|nr:clostripain-related cysteine peptidase [Spirulina major]
MKRRRLIQYGFLSSAICLSNLTFLNRKSVKAREANKIKDKNHYDWVFLYWMPYDNNLSRFGQPIIDMISRGVQTNNLLVGVESDFLDSDNLSRRIIKNGDVKVEDINATDSSDADIFAEYLDWAYSQFSAKKWGIVIVGHGGKLDEISPDDNPDSNSNQTQWMNIKDVKKVIEDFNRKIHDRIELFFFQNCNKGTLEVHHTLCDVAKYTLSSPVILGAPNYYYESLFQLIGQNPDVDGEYVARKIAEFERSDMYSTYIVTRNENLLKVIESMNRLIDSILESENNLRLQTLNSNNIYFGSRYVDIIDFFNELTNIAEADQAKYLEFVDLLNSSVLKMQNPNEIALNSMGLSLFVPSNINNLNSYLDLPIYTKSKLLELFGAIL